MLVLTLDGECNFLFSTTSSSLSCHELLPGYHLTLYPSITPVQLTFETPTVQEGMKGNQRVGWRRSRVPVYRGKIRRGRGSSTKEGLRFLRRRFRLDFDRETPNGDPFRVTAHRTDEDEYRLQGRGPWRCRYRSRTGWGPPLVGPYIATTTTVCDRVPSFSSLSIAARVDRTSVDPGTYVSKPLRHFVFWNTPIICRRDGL